MQREPGKGTTLFSCYRKIPHVVVSHFTFTFIRWWRGPGGWTPRAWKRKEKGEKRKDRERKKRKGKKKERK
jgi:hypothetical protein